MTKTFTSKNRGNKSPQQNFQHRQIMLKKTKPEDQTVKLWSIYGTRWKNSDNFVAGWLIFGLERGFSKFPFSWHGNSLVIINNRNNNTFPLFLILFFCSYLSRTNWDIFLQSHLNGKKKCQSTLINERRHLNKTVTCHYFPKMLNVT